MKFVIYDHEEIISFNLMVRLVDLIHTKND